MTDGLYNEVQPGDIIIDLNQWHGIALGIVFGETKIGRIRYIRMYSNGIHVDQEKTYAKENNKTVKVTLDEAREYIRRICTAKWRDEEELIANRYIARLEELVMPNEV